MVRSESVSLDEAWEFVFSSLFPGDVDATDFRLHVSSSLQARIHLIGQES